MPPPTTPDDCCALRDEGKSVPVGDGVLDVPYKNTTQPSVEWKFSVRLSRFNR